MLFQYYRKKKKILVQFRTNKVSNCFALETVYCVNSNIFNHLTVTFCSVSHRKLYWKPTSKLTTAQLLMCFYLFNNGRVGILRHSGAVCFDKKDSQTGWIHQKWKDHLLKEAMCRLKICLWQLQNTPHKIFERVETWQLCDCLHGNGERVSLG